MRHHRKRAFSVTRGLGVRDASLQPKMRQLRLEVLEDRLNLAVGLVAAYAFNEGTGSSVADSSGSGNVGSVANPTWSSSGKFGGALSFNGLDTLVNVPDSALLDLTTGMTLEAWINPSSVTSAWRDVIYKGADVYYLEATSSNNGNPAGGATVGASTVEAYGTAALTTGVWSHLALTFDGSNMVLYVNGVQISSQSGVGTIPTSASDLQIGGDTVHGRAFEGLIDEVRVYNRALSAAEIQTDMNLPVAVSVVSPIAGATVSHVVPISAAGGNSDTTASVEFFVDGNSLGTDSTAPFFMNWNSTTAASGSHTLSAIARDSLNNLAPATSIVVTSQNPVFFNETIVPNMTYATTIKFLPDGRMLVGEMINKIWIVQPGANGPDPVPLLDLGYDFLFGEQGLMDIALDPNFATNGYYYIFYSKGFEGPHNRDRVSRFTMSGSTTVPGSELLLYEDTADSGLLHHGGALAFGNDGKLYIAIGEHYIPELSQDLTSSRGKVLRINPDGTVPTDDPFYDGAGPNYDAIWAYGLRNPYRMSIDPVTGTMYIGDVGGNDPNTAWEEVDIGVRGANYGWPLEEGNGNAVGTTHPIYTFFHNGRDSCVTGGFVYRGSGFPSEYDGSYFFADYAQKTIKRLIFDASGNVADVVNFWPPDGHTDDQTAVGDPVKLVPGPDGSLYYVDIGFDGFMVPNPATIRRIRFSDNNLPPVPLYSTTTPSGSAPLQVGFSSFGSYDPEGALLTYLWTFGDGGTSTNPFPSHVYETAGQYTAHLSVSDGNSATLSGDIVVTVGTPPVPTILGPINNSLFRAGDVINYSASATDAEDGTLPASAFSWTILFHHDNHTHPGGGPFVGSASGTLTIPTSGHDFEDQTYYEIVLTVTDSTGLTASTSVSIYPDKVNLAFDTVPSGLSLSIDGIVRQAPFVIDDLIGFQHTIDAPTQSSSGTLYGFASWSDAGSQTHVVVTPATNQNYLATFQTGSVARRQLFYNQSSWDGGVDSITTGDDSAIATDKTAYIAGSGSASSTALSSYTRGINGVMVDLLGPGATRRSTPATSSSRPATTTRLAAGPRRRLRF